MLPCILPVSPLFPSLWINEFFPHQLFPQELSYRVVLAMINQLADYIGLKTGNVAHFILLSINFSPRLFCSYNITSNKNWVYDKSCLSAFFSNSGKYSAVSDKRKLLKTSSSCL